MNLEYNPLQKGFDLQEGKQEITNLVSFVKKKKKKKKNSENLFHDFEGPHEAPN